MQTAERMMRVLSHPTINSGATVTKRLSFIAITPGKWCNRQTQMVKWLIIGHLAETHVFWWLSQKSSIHTNMMKKLGTQFFFELCLDWPGNNNQACNDTSRWQQKSTRKQDSPCKAQKESEFISLLQKTKKKWIHFFVKKSWIYQSIQKKKHPLVKIASFQMINWFFDAKVRWKQLVPRKPKTHDTHKFGDLTGTATCKQQTWKCQKPFSNSPQKCWKNEGTKQLFWTCQNGGGWCKDKKDSFETVVTGMWNWVELAGPKGEWNMKRVKMTISLIFSLALGLPFMSCCDRCWWLLFLLPPPFHLFSVTDGSRFLHHKKWRQCQLSQMVLFVLLFPKWKGKKWKSQMPKGNT